MVALVLVTVAELVIAVTVLGLSAEVMVALTVVTTLEVLIGGALAEVIVVSVRVVE